MMALARVYLKTNRFDDARKMMEAAAQADPSLKESTLLLQNFNEEFKPTYAAKKKKSYRKSLKKGRKSKISRKKRSGGTSNV